MEDLLLGHLVIIYDGTLLYIPNLIDHRYRMSRCLELCKFTAITHLFPAWWGVPSPLEQCPTLAPTRPWSSGTCTWRPAWHETYQLHSISSWRYITVSEGAVLRFLLLGRCIFAWSATKQSCRYIMIHPPFLSQLCQYVRSWSTCWFHLPSSWFTISILVIFFRNLIPWSFRGFNDCLPISGSLVRLIHCSSWWFQPMSKISIKIGSFPQFFRAKNLKICLKPTTSEI